jgi:uncharacterized protein (DUF1330 family)
MAAYVIFMREKIIDPDEMDNYIKKAASGFVGHPVKVLVSHARFEVMEGPAVESVVILEFPSLEEAKYWYESPAYHESLQHRLKGGQYRCVMAEGVK